VLNDRMRATNDSFTYRVVDPNRNAVDDQRSAGFFPAFSTWGGVTG
jgi:hypothetical protein